MVKGTKKRKYTPEFRDAAVRLVTVEKVPASKAAADLAMPVNTLNLWVSQSRHFTRLARQVVVCRPRRATRTVRC